MRAGLRGRERKLAWLGFFWGRTGVFPMYQVRPRLLYVDSLSLEGSCRDITLTNFLHVWSARSSGTKILKAIIGLKPQQPYAPSTFVRECKFMISWRMVRTFHETINRGHLNSRGRSTYPRHWWKLPSIAAKSCASVCGSTPSLYSTLR